MRGSREDLSGNVYGALKVIGDTGKNDKWGAQIVIVRNLVDDNIYEFRASNLKRGAVNGYGPDVRSFTSRSKNPNSTSGYKNISYCTQKNRWLFQVWFLGEYHRKFFIDFKKAVIYRNDFYIKKLNPIIFNENEKFKEVKEEDIILNSFVIEKQKEINDSLFSRMKKSKGYSWRGDVGKWQARITIDKKVQNLGFFSTEHEAKAARKKAVDEQIEILKKQLEKDEL